MGRPKAARLRAIAAEQGWLEPEVPLPEDAAIAAVVGAARRARSTISTVEPYRALVERWAAEGVSGVATRRPGGLHEHWRHHAPLHSRHDQRPAGDAREVPSARATLPAADQDRLAKD
jgi:hypothetical protein